MSLQSRLGDLITAIGADVKALQNRRQHTIVANHTITGANVENIVKQVTVPANTLIAGSVIKVQMFITAGSVSPIMPKLRLGPAGTTSDILVGNLTSQISITPINGHSVYVEFLFTLRAPGVSGVAQAACNMLAIAGNSAVAAGQIANVPTITTANLDTTVTNILSVDVQQVTAAGTVNQCVVEIIP